MLADIPFTPDDWTRVHDTYEKWWTNELDRPLLHVTLTGRNPDVPEPDIPSYGFQAFYDDNLPVEKIVDRMEYNLACGEYVGDAFPHCWPNFGAGVIAAFLGAQLEKSDTTVWFHPPHDRELKDISFEFVPDNFWFNRVRDVARAAARRFQGRAQIGMTDLGGNLDILASFRPGENLLLDLYDCPDEVKRLTWEAHNLWFRYFNLLNEATQPNQGYTAWTPILSKTPYYMLQCDFCYMISPDMFDKFVRPELAAACGKIDRPFYHLDGPGQVPHLDSLLEIPTLAGVQWIPGAGQPSFEEWPEVYRKIFAAGKKSQIFLQAESWDENVRIFDELVNRTGDAQQFIFHANAPIDRRDDVMRVLERYGAA